MNKNLILVLLYFISFPVPSQNGFDEPVYREINEQIFDTDNFFPKYSVQTNKSFEILNGRIKTEKIIYPDNLIIINEYNKESNLIHREVFKNETLRETYRFEYKADGKTILRERGLNNLNYNVIDSTKNSIKYYAVKTSDEKQGFFYKNLDTLFINETKYSYEYIAKSNSQNSPIETHKYRFEVNGSGNLKKIQIFQNDIKVGHFINNYDENNLVTSQELFWKYEWFFEDTGFPSVRNQVRNIKYDNKLIKSITNESYNATKREWEKSIKNYNCKIISREKDVIANCDCDDGQKIKIIIDDKGNWVQKSFSSNEKSKTYRRELKYYK